jgi:hypothetical protein
MLYLIAYSSLEKRRKFGSFRPPQNMAWNIDRHVDYIKLPMQGNGIENYQTPHL